MLLDIMTREPYALALSPGFFRFYALIGVLDALDDHNCLEKLVTHISGASAGAMVGGFYAAGMSPQEMVDQVMTIKREQIWDMGGLGGLLKGNYMQALLEQRLPVSTIEEARIPVGFTAWEIFGFRTRLIQSGNLATAIRASCCFPGLFQPVGVEGTLCIDGGVFDKSGMMALPGVPDSNLIINIVCDRSSLASSILPERFKNCRLLTLVLDNIPGVNPLTMDTAGPIAYRTAKAATYNALRSSHIQQMSHNHWVAYIDGSTVTDLDAPLEKAVASGSFNDSAVSLTAFAANNEAETSALSRKPSYSFLKAPSDDNLPALTVSSVVINRSLSVTSFSACSDVDDSSSTSKGRNNSKAGNKSSSSQGTIGATTPANKKEAISTRTPRTPASNPISIPSALTHDNVDSVAIIATKQPPASTKKQKQLASQSPARSSAPVTNANVISGALASGRSWSAFLEHASVFGLDRFNQQSQVKGRQNAVNLNVSGSGMVGVFFSKDSPSSLSLSGWYLAQILRQATRSEVKSTDAGRVTHFVRVFVDGRELDCLVDLSQETHLHLATTNSEPKIVKSALKSGKKRKTDESDNANGSDTDVDRNTVGSEGFQWVQLVSKF